MMFRFQSLPDKAGECGVVFHNKNSHECLLSRLDSEPILILHALAMAHKITSPYEGTYRREWNGALPNGSARGGRFT
jgi:hypothetical protein